MSLIQSTSTLITSLTDTFGYGLPISILIVIYLLIRYPDRLVGTHGDRPGVYRIPGHPLIGNLIGVVKRGTKNQFEHFLGVARSCPPGSPNWIWTIPPQGTIIFLNHPAYLEHIQKTNFLNYPKGTLLRNAFSDFLGSKGIFVADGEEWKRSRKMASRVFSVGLFRRVVTTVVHEELRAVDGLLEALTEGGKEGSIELPNLFFRYTLSSFAKMAFGADIDCLSSDPACLQKEVPFATAFDSAQEHINGRFSKPGWQLWERFTPTGAKMRAWTKVMRKFAREIIENRLKELEQQEQKTRAIGEKSDEKGFSVQTGEDSEDKDRSSASSPAERTDKDLLSLFMDMTRDPEELLAVVLNFIIAGRDTTAQSLSWLFIELFSHPEHIPPMLDEINLLFPPSSSSPASSEANLLAYDDLRHLPYMQACLAESIRLHPPVPKNSKIAVQDDLIVPLGSAGTDTIPPPVQVYAGERVAWSDWVMARLPEVWGSDCAEYQPRRFLIQDEVNDDDASGSTTGWKFNTSLGPWKFHAFNGGPRLCLGMNLAYFEAMALLTLILPKWNVSWTRAQTQTQTGEGRNPFIDDPSHAKAGGGGGEAQVCKGKRPPPPGRTKEQEERDGWQWPPTYKSSLTHPSEDYSATFVRR